MRSEDSIANVEDEFTDRIWYERKLVMIENMKDGLEDISEDLMDKVTDAMRKVESKYPGVEQGVMSDFEWGMINGKLSALRWVLGDDWDMLDT